MLPLFRKQKKYAFLKNKMCSTGWVYRHTETLFSTGYNHTFSVQALPNTEKCIPLVSFKILCSGERNSDNGDLDGIGNTSGELGTCTSTLEYSHQPCSDSEDHSVVSVCSSVIY